MLDGALTSDFDTPLLAYTLNERPNSPRLSAPAPGRSLGATVARVERPVREAVRLINRAVAVNGALFSSIFDCSVYGPGCLLESSDVRLSWFVVGAAVTHALMTRREKVASFPVSLEWFFGDVRRARSLLACFPLQQINAAESELGNLTVSADLLDLLPYVLEPHGHITRNSLETCEVAKKTREVKKDAGVYYTPSDVADFMVRSLASTSGVSGTWIDPACGTGVFLRAVLAYCRTSDPQTRDLREFTLSSVFGIDKSALATDLAAFVLLAECASSASSEHSAFDVWQQLKGNIACMDSLRLTPSGGASELHDDQPLSVEVTDVFPKVGRNLFDRVVMNPPYATVRIDKSLQASWHSFSDIAIGQTADMHLAFSEMLWRLTSKGGASAAVLPLSIGSNTTKSYVRFREELLRSSGTKEFLFFDREPQALFGEDIKTRNLIVLRKDVSDEAEVRTSRLLKWTAEQRPSIFNENRLVSIEAQKCKTFVPKVGSDAERDIYDRLSSAVSLTRATVFAPRSFRISFDDAVKSTSGMHSRTLLVSGTAYNFINCFFSTGLPAYPPRPYSSSPLNALLFSSEEDAYAAFALISSRLCFWLWHVEGDGFHLTSNFLKRLPVWSCFGTEMVKQRLSEHGRLLWRSGSAAAVGAVNGGKQTYSFHCGYDHSSALEVERMLLKHLSLDDEVSGVLDDFVRATVSIDGKRRLRRSDPELKELV
ncbi:N-6 DNA methylase [Paraburkholderia solisilvae]|uniref:site-specific DNA-methyltransferase (adenine-specific) n=1 Tax=Paraburkholderia solisilvae TaxID=624376 RepID=A0A6J5ECU9_9BURK|nr:N-6 DNA methylase [Paraburkholderia solisilvae]CAB3764289.1 hypothetical protein LMG29739_04325 [Paraburkholderia solisilvae]